jgi:N-acetylmuramic acid 6-phosphate etherase
VIGCSYFGARIVRHVARDMEDLARRGYTGVLHTFSENDLAYYRDTMKEIVEASHGLGLEVQMNPWGLGRTFGGEAESRFVTLQPDACQVLDDGRRVSAGCLNNAEYRAYCREWADAALEAGADRVFWDEPHWVEPEHVGVEAARWGCRCEVCRERYADRHGGDMPTSLTPEVVAFREASLVDFLREMVAHAAARGGRSTICLLPLVGGAHGVSDWDAVASLPGLDTFATDPYWNCFDEPAVPFVQRFARLLADTAERNGVAAELWVPSFRLTAADVPDLEAAIAAARAEGVTSLWTWGYEACKHMSHLATPDSDVVWEAVTRALVRPDVSGPEQDGRAPVTERHRPELADLDLRPTRDLVELINADDHTVASAVAAAAGSLAEAIDEIAARLARGGRLIYVGAGSSGRLAAVDAAECGPTFSAGDQVIALVAGGVAAVATVQEAAEDDLEGGVADIDAIGIGPDDAVVALSASGRTPYVLGAVERAAAAGALTAGVVCVPDSPLGSAADHEVLVVVGPEVIAGSTRMKAGTAQKLVLNTISTVAMVRLGRTFGNLMVDVCATNEKLRERARRIVELATGASGKEVDTALSAADGEVKVAIVSLLDGLDAAAARERLEAAGGVVRLALRESA